jgi:hypothetical protein
MRKWRASLVRKRARVLGDVEALTQQEAQLAAITKFNLDDEQRSRLVVQKAPDRPPIWPPQTGAPPDCDLVNH